MNRILILLAAAGILLTPGCAALGPQVTGPASLMTNPNNPMENVGVQHNRLLAKLVKIKGDNPEDTQQRLWRAAAAASAGRLNSADYRNPQEALAAFRTRALGPTNAASFNRYFGQLGAAIERSPTYATAMATIAQSEAQLIRDRSVPPATRSALLAAYSTARYSAYFWASGQGGEALKVKWWTIVVADALGAFVGVFSGGGVVGGVVVGAVWSIGQASSSLVRLPWECDPWRPWDCIWRCDEWHPWRCGNTNF